ncbi:hypothetical protein D3C72_2027900 [compost metagenome]
MRSAGHGRPAVAARQQLPGYLGGQREAEVVQQAFQLLVIQGQRAGIQLVQVALEEQAWQAPGRAPSPVDPPAQLVRRLLEQVFQAGVQLGAGLSRIVVEDQPGGLVQAGEQVG